jgi:peptidoglycan hydrolase-like protein with peptidoglycan-binding domain
MLQTPRRELCLSLSGWVRQRRCAADTRLVQQLLAIRGFDTGGIDGLAGPRTTAAIAAFTQPDRGSARMRQMRGCSMPSLPGIRRRS